MPVSAQTEDISKEDGSTGKKLHVEFTNGSLNQLEELAEYYSVPSGDVAEVVKLGISLLQNFKDQNKLNTNKS